MKNHHSLILSHKLTQEHLFCLPHLLLLPGYPFERYKLGFLQIAWLLAWCLVAQSGLLLWMGIRHIAYYGRSVCLIFMYSLGVLLFSVKAISCAELAPEDINEESSSRTYGSKTETPGRHGVDAKGHPHWLEIAPGLEYGEFRQNEDEVKLAVLRIDPEKYDFFLGLSNADEKGARPLAQWAKDYDLLGAINASMYLPNNTSTGYMRYGEHINNPRIVERFGAFFVASPKKEGIPRAMIMDKSSPNWRETLKDYNLVVQNYRIINDKRRILWSPGGPHYSISAVAQDGKGNILFLHSRKPVEAYSFAQQLLHLPLDIRTVMYVEGGAQAGMLVRSPQVNRDLGAPHAPSLLVTGNIKAALPNILGVMAKKD